MMFKSMDEKIASELKLSKKLVRSVLRAAENQMYNDILFGQEIVISNIGKFLLKMSKPRYRRNIHTGKNEHQEARYRLVFRVSTIMIDKLGKKIVYDGSKKNENY